MTRSTHTLPAPGTATTTPPAGRLPRFLRWRRPVSTGVVAALCAALAAPVSAPALLATGATALLAAGAPSRAWATTTIPGIGVVVKKNKPPVKHMATTNQDGRYDFKDLEPGTYDLLIEGQPPRKVVVGQDGRLSGVVTGPAKTMDSHGAAMAAPQTRGAEPEATRRLGGQPVAVVDKTACRTKSNCHWNHGTMQCVCPEFLVAPAASDIPSVPTGNPTPVPKGAAPAAPTSTSPSGQPTMALVQGATELKDVRALSADDLKPPAPPQARQTVRAQALADGYFVKFAGQPQGFKLDTVKGTIEELPAGMPPRPAADAPVPAPARLQAFLKDQKTGQIVPLVLGGDGFVLPGGLEDGRHRYALKVTGGGLGDRPCPPGCGEAGYLAVSIDKGAPKSAGSPKAESF